MPGDYLCIEDTNPEGLAIQDTKQEQPESWGPAKLNVMRRFLEKHTEKYVVDQFYTDFFGWVVCTSWQIL